MTDLATTLILENGTGRVLAERDLSARPLTAAEIHRGILDWAYRRFGIRYQAVTALARGVARVTLSRN